MLILSTTVPPAFLNFRHELPIMSSQPLVFMDIETMGLSRKRDPIILIGMMILGAEEGFLQQYFCQEISDEKEMLTVMSESIPPDSLVISYNGRAFDIPYINQRLAMYGFDYRILPARGIDLMYWAKKALPDAPRHTLKAVEVCMGIYREDTLSGAECVQQYNEYLQTKDPQLGSQICKHNYEDILHMAPLLKLYAMLPLDSPHRNLPFYLVIEERCFWIEPPVYKNGFLTLKGCAEHGAASNSVNYTGSASLQIVREHLEVTLPVSEFAYPELESLFIDTDRIPGFAPTSFNELSLESKILLMIRSGSSYVPEALTNGINRLLAMK